MKRTFTFLVSALLITLAIPAYAGDYAVVVNANNGYSGTPSAMKEQVKRLFLKKQSAWPSGEKAVAFARDSGSAEQSAFDKNVLSMTQSELDAHWARLKQTVGETPPRSIGSASLVARQVGRKPGGVGIVSKADAASLSGVKVLFEF